MENQIQAFTSEVFGEVRTVSEGDKVLFCGSDVAKALGYKEPEKAIRTHCKGVSKIDTPTNGGIQAVGFIPEGDVYRLIASSKLVNAVKFESWLFDDVLPTIRKHGGYLTPAKIEAVMNDPDAWIRMLTAIKTEREQNEELKATNLNMLVRQEKDAPKVELAEAISEPDGSVLIRDFEKLLRSRGYQIENNGLYKWMRDENLIKPQYPNQHGGWSYIAPKKALKDGLMYNRRGKTGGLMAPVITPKGQDYILDNIGGFANQQTKVTAPAESASAMSILKLQGKLNRDGLKVAGYQGQWLFEFLKAKKLIKACGHKGKASVYSATPAAVKNGWFVNMRNKSGYISSTAVTPSGVEHITSLVKAEG